LQEIWLLYTSGKQTYSQLAERYFCSTKTIGRWLDKVQVQRCSEFGSVANVIMDTTYFGDIGVMVFKNSLDGAILFKQYVKNETNDLYLFGIQEIARRGIGVQAIICDGKSGIFSVFSDIPMQMCQFHMLQIITRKLTRKPQSQAAKELRKLTLKLTEQSREEFTNNLNNWYLLWKNYLFEKSISPTTGKPIFTHKRLRSAYRSLKKHLPYLFVYQNYKELMIPNTTNALDGLFSDLKNKLRNHNGLSKQRKMRYIDGFLKA
jgi:hypothetical protein